MNVWRLSKATENDNYWPLNVLLGILKVGDNWINIYTQNELNFEPLIWENKTESVPGTTVALNTRAQVSFLINASNYWYYCSHIMLETSLLSQNINEFFRHQCLSPTLIKLHFEISFSLNGPVGHLFKTTMRLISFVLLEITEMKISIIVKWESMIVIKKLSAFWIRKK